MPYEPVASSDVLWEGPLFADEIGWQEGLTSTLREQFDLRSLRVIPAKSAMSGVVSIYFRPVHRQWALVRYAKRYRWIFEILLRQGMSGERRLLDNDFVPEDIAFLDDIVPRPERSITPAVYDILWRAAPFPEHIRVVAAIDDRSMFTPRDVIESTDDVTPEDTFVFNRLIRSHLIQRKGAGIHPNDRSDGPRNSVSADLDAEYQLTPEGKEALPTILEEYERIFEREEFEPLRINPELDPESHLPDQSGASTAGSTTDTAATTADREDSDGILEELEEEFSALTDDSDAS